MLCKKTLKTYPDGVKVLPQRPSPKQNPPYRKHKKNNELNNKVGKFRYTPRNPPASDFCTYASS